MVFLVITGNHPGIAQYLVKITFFILVIAIIFYNSKLFNAKK